jgi:hypothetical protein
MNVVLRYLKEKLSTDEYLFQLANMKKNQTIITRYIKESNHDRFYLLQHCVKKLPLDLDKIDIKTRRCQVDPSSHRRFGMYDDTACRNCWVKILENPDKFLNLKPVVPKFLIENKPKARPNFLR